ncbi:DNA alkylation repair protein [Arthrobacter sp. I2-34]|uniref:DNA alkylation repair protein n=1 Tax=Arthrobacter hankyongi TaxID=2904801 RepID=A0ABS9LB45_9MICC|nr:DNA alkylation repair protein [Arthrobacter hankyongi]MCG2623733.1 DNA alkylation repair protein [Arthrobacter hankyongi]
MSEAGEFVDAALQREGSWQRAAEQQAGQGRGLRYYGASVGAVRGTVRDASRRYRGLTHDDVTALSSELWAVPVFERRLAAVVLLQSNVRLLDNGDLTRLEGFVREARLPALVDPLAVDVIGPLVEALQPRDRARAETILDRWAQDRDIWLRRAVLLSPLRALRTGGGDWDRLVRRAKGMLAQSPDDAGEAVREVLATVQREVAKTGRELRFPAAVL